MVVLFVWQAALVECFYTKFDVVLQVFSDYLSKELILLEDEDSAQIQMGILLSDISLALS